jgi:superfamily II DNA/RNA helicase
MKEVDRSSKNRKSKIQVCLFSATIPRWVIDIARQYMSKDFKIVDLAKNLRNKTAK